MHARFKTSCAHGLESSSSDRRLLSSNQDQHLREMAVITGRLVILLDIKDVARSRDGVL